MKKCNYCNIYISGKRNHCPLCNNALEGEATSPHWPGMKRLRLKGFIYKLQAFLVLATIIICLALDFLMDVRGERHWSIVVLIWGLGIEGMVRHFIRRRLSAAAIITDIALAITVLLLITGRLLDFLYPIATYVAPYTIAALLLTNLILALIDKKGNALVYLLGNILMGMIPYVIYKLMKMTVPLSWIICLTVSVVVLLGICIFRGRSVKSELEKRLNM